MIGKTRVEVEVRIRWVTHVSWSDWTRGLLPGIEYIGSCINYIVKDKENTDIVDLVTFHSNKYAYLTVEGVKIGSGIWKSETWCTQQTSNTFNMLSIWG